MTSQAQGPAIRLSYLICASPRSGSNFLCEALRSTSFAGRPDDYFWNRPYWNARWGVTSFADFIRRLLREGTTANGAFGSKLMRDQLSEVVPELVALLNLTHAEPPAVLQALFPNLHYVWLRRLDKVRQGISYYRALETRRWRSTDVDNVSEVDPPFNFEAIRTLVELSVWEDQGWQAFFDRHAIEPLTVTYEDLAQAPETVVRGILRHLGLPAPARVPSETWRHQRQADGLTDAWAAQYEVCARAPE